MSVFQFHITTLLTKDPNFNKAIIIIYSSNESNLSYKHSRRLAVQDGFLTTTAGKFITTYVILQAHN
jgi:hypothetical protein